VELEIALRQLTRDAVALYAVAPNSTEAADLSMTAAHAQNLLEQQAS
jgi:hypothetical protein